jgi:hypothetical protein
MTTPRPRGWAWWHAVALIDLGLVAFLLVSPWLPDGLAADIVRDALILDREMTVAVWWAAGLLLLAAALMYELAGRPDATARVPWVILAGLTLALSFDEVASVHERVGRDGWGPLIPVAVVGALAVAYALATLARQASSRLAGLLALGYALLASSGVQEAIAQRVEWGTGPIRLVFEEGAELLGGLLVLAAAAAARGGGGRGALAILPRPARLYALPILLALGLVANALVSIFVSPKLDDLGVRGNPAAWYPSVVYALAASEAAWTATASVGARRRAWAALAGLLGVCSLGMIYNLVSLAPHIDAVLPRWAFEGVYATYLFLVVPVALAALGARVAADRPGQALAGAAVLLALLLVYRRVPDWHVAAVAPSLVAWTWSWALRPARRPS